MHKPPAPGGKAAGRRVFSAKDEDRFLAAVTSGNLAKVKQYLQRGYDPSSNSSYALKLALKSYPVLSELLIAHGARVQDVAVDTLSWLRQYGPPSDVWKVELILSHLTLATISPRFLSLALADAALVKPILKIGVDPNDALISALHSRHAQSAIALLDAGASPLRAHQRLNRDRSLLSLACTSPNLTEVVHRLLLAGAHPDDPAREPPLIEAIDSTAIDSARLLLRFGADPDLCSPGSAAFRKLQTLIPDLLRHGATFRSEPVIFSDAMVPLEILGLLLRARIQWAHRYALRMVQHEVPRGTTQENARAMALAHASLVYPDMQPQKLL